MWVQCFYLIFLLQNMAQTNRYNTQYEIDIYRTELLEIK